MFLTGFDLLDKRLKGPYLSGDALTIGDLAVLSLLSMILDGMFDHVPGSYLDSWPRVFSTFFNNQTFFHNLDNNKLHLM